MEQHPEQTVNDVGLETTNSRELDPGLTPWRQRQRGWRNRQASLDSKISGLQQNRMGRNDLNGEDIEERDKTEGIAQDVFVRSTPLFHFNQSVEYSGQQRNNFVRRFSVHEVQLSSASGITFSVYQPVNIYTSSVFPVPQKSLGRRHSSYIAPVTCPGSWYVVLTPIFYWRCI